MKKLLSFIFLLFTSVLFSQPTGSTAELEMKLKSHKKEDTIKVLLLNDLAWEIGYTDPRKAIIYCHQAKFLSKKLNFLNGEAEAYNELGNAYRFISRFDSAYYYLGKALQIRKNQGHEQKVAAVTINIGNVYTQELKYPEAILKYKEALEIAERTNYQKASLIGLTNLSDIYRAVGMTDKALLCMKEALKINNELKNRAQEPYIYSVLATIMNDLGNSVEAIAYNQKALRLIKETPDDFLLTTVLNNLGSQLKDINKTDSALIVLQEALKLEAKNNDSIGMGATAAAIAMVYLQTKQYDFALAYSDRAFKISSIQGDSLVMSNALLISADIFEEKKDFKRALAFALQAEPIVLKINKHVQLYETYMSFSKIYKGLALHDKRAESLEKIIRYRDSVISDENKQLSTRLHVEMDLYGKEKEIELLSVSAALKEVELSKQKTARRLITGIAVLFGLVVLVIVFFFLKIRKSNLIINKQKERVEAQNDIIKNQKQLVEEKQKEIIDSINYAKRIQNAVLTGEEVWNKVSKDHFILFQPKDIVSGDFYWAYNTANNRSVFALADCTGHGVPGGFMSMLGNSFLNEIVVENKIFNAASILNKLREKIISALEQKGEEQRRDGMDVALCVWNKLNNTLEFAGANNALLLLRDGTLTEFKPDKMPIGTFIGNEKPFSSQTIQLLEGDCLYMTTDGFPDQFGGPKGKKFKYRQLEELIVSSASLSMKEQGKVLKERFQTWKQKMEQVDDVSIIGLRV
jgi:serine phosphatase RsbU (regulator of sigma subunit)